MSAWIDALFKGVPDAERRVVERYTEGLLKLARENLPQRFRGRVDAEDVVQSVYRSFFRRLNDDQFTFQDSHDVWRLLVVMTYHKVKNLIKHHERNQRDVRREERRSPADSKPGLEGAARAPGPEDLVIFYDCLEQLIRGLPDKYRTVLVLRLEGHAIAEIATQVGYSERTVIRVLGNCEASAVRWLEGVS